MSEVFILKRCPYCNTDYGPDFKPRHTPTCPLLLSQLKASGIDPKDWIREHTHTEESK